MLDAGRTDETLLEVNNIEVIYNHVILVLKGVSLTVPKGGSPRLLGGNGAGKTTTLKAISSLLRSERGEVTKGTITYRGQKIQDLSPNDLVKMGVIQVMEGRHCFEHLTVEENLLTGAYTRRDGSGGDPRRSRDGLRLLSPLARAPEIPGRLYLGRRAADDRDRPGADVAPRDDPAG
jgi:branched-chain amino acid transport system ATP-binding protein